MSLRLQQVSCPCLDAGVTRVLVKLLAHGIEHICCCCGIICFFLQVSNLRHFYQARSHGGAFGGNAPRNFVVP